MATMAHIYPLQILIDSLAGLISRQQAQVLEYLIEENRVLKEQLGGKRPRLTDDQRRRLAAKGKRIGRQLLMKFACTVTRQIRSSAGTVSSLRTSGRTSRAVLGVQVP